MAAPNSAAPKAKDYAWSEPRCLQLIKEYRARPILWDKTSPFYYKQQMRPDAWDEIGAALKIPPAICKYKMNVLLSSFRREKAKSLKNKDGNKRYKSSWFAFKEMAFCMKKSTGNLYTTDDDIFMASLLKVKPSNELQKRSNSDHNNKEKNIRKKKIKYKSQIDEQSSSSDVDVELVEEKEAETSQQPIFGPIISITQADQSQLPKSCGTPMISVTQLPSVTQMPKDPPHTKQEIQSTSEDEEEINSFTTFIASKMKKFSKNTKNMVQKEICDIIFKADQGFYEKTTDESHNSANIDARRFHVEHPVLKNDTVIKTYLSDGE